MFNFCERSPFKITHLPSDVALEWSIVLKYKIVSSKCLNKSSKSFFFGTHSKNQIVSIKVKYKLTFLYVIGFGLTFLYVIGFGLEGQNPSSFWLPAKQIIVL